MADKSRIEWTDATWNPLTGCDRVSPGCAHCYALTGAKRWKAMGNPRYQVDGDPRTSGPGFGLTVHADKIDDPLRWTRPRRIFVNSTSDLFHAGVLGQTVEVGTHRIPFLAAVFAVMAMSPRHTFQVLTKRPEIMRAVLSHPRLRLDVNTELLRRGAEVMQGGIDSPWPANIWLGTSVENQHWADVRIPELLATPAAVRFISAEPLLGPVTLRDIDWSAAQPGLGNKRLHWVIVGGESGPGHRPFDPDWARSLRDECENASVAYFFKQHGGQTPKAGGRELDGRTWDQMPAVGA